MDIKTAIEVIKAHGDRIGSTDFLETCMDLDRLIDEDSYEIGFKEAIAMRVFREAGRRMFAPVEA